MARKGLVENNLRRQRLAVRFREKRARLRKAGRDMSLTPEERFAAHLALAALPRNSSPVRYRNRCALTGRPRGYYRKLGLSRIALRECALFGLIPGMTKASW